MSTEQLQELGPIDYIVLEWAGDQPVTGEVMPLLLDLVDRGVIRILDLAFLVKAEDGSVAAIDLAEAAKHDTGLAAFEGASSGLLSQDDLEEAATALEPGTVAGVLVWENRWAAPVAIALRRSGGQLVASGRIPIQAIVAALDALEATDCSEEHLRGCSAASSAPQPSPAPPRRSATACHAAVVPIVVPALMHRRAERYLQGRRG